MANCAKELFPALKWGLSLFAETQTKQYSKAARGKGLVHNVTSAVTYTSLKHAADLPLPGKNVKQSHAFSRV